MEHNGLAYVLEERISNELACAEEDILERKAVSSAITCLYRADGILVALDLLISELEPGDPEIRVRHGKRIHGLSVNLHRLMALLPRKASTTSR